MFIPNHQYRYSIFLLTNFLLLHSVDIYISCHYSMSNFSDKLLYSYTDYPNTTINILAPLAKVLEVDMNTLFKDV